MNRRKFLQNITLGSGAVLLSFNGFGQLLSSKKSSKLTILHTNDTHSNIDPFPSNHAKFPGMGGVSRRHALIQKIRQDEEHVLLLDCGDIFQGTPYFNMFNGELEVKLMSEMGYDAATMGNHDFDIGLEGFKKAKRHAKFSFLCANYDFSETILSGETKSFEIFQKGDLKIGVFGIGIELNGLVTENNYGKTKYLDPITTANSVAKELKQKGCDLIICLSHLGYNYPDSTRISDRKLAQQTSNIDIILGGHTHTFLEKPTIEINKKGKSVLINQVGYAGLYLGRIDIDVEKGVTSRRIELK
ncbi:MAG: bifunctional metallophosphatase/5'-nucleotidase [Bacteroidetes bacterium]|nr:bifunctional metallophosphatase/5'-nucleotidase [Bacteroidota bacterium]